MIIFFLGMKILAGCDIKKRFYTDTDWVILLTLP